MGGTGNRRVRAGARTGVRVARALALLGALALALTARGSASAVSGASDVARLAKGKFLVANRSLRDPNFAQSVILLVDHNARGALGVVVNRPTPIRLVEALPQIAELERRPDVVYVGGPVAPDHMLVLVRTKHAPPEALQIFEQVYASGNLEALRESLVRGDGVRAYAGYAGWAPGQLEAEVGRGDWLIGSADSALIFDEAPNRVWSLLLERFSGDWAARQAVRRLRG